MLSSIFINDINRPLLDRFLDEAQRVGVLNQRPNFRTIQTGWNFGIDLEFQGHLAAGKGRELLDDGLDDLMNIPRRPLRLAPPRNFLAPPARHRSGRGHRTR